MRIATLCGMGFGVYIKAIASPSEVINNGYYSSTQGSEQTNDDQDPDLSGQRVSLRPGQ